MPKKRKKGRTPDWQREPRYRIDPLPGLGENCVLVESPRGLKVVGADPARLLELTTPEGMQKVLNELYAE